jgi:hypothetical protein
MWPFGPYQLSLIIARRLHRFPATPNTNGRTLDATGCTFAICLCVYNEEAVIAKKMDDILALQETMEGELEILVYVDAAREQGQSSRSTRIAFVFLSRLNDAERLTA